MLGFSHRRHRRPAERSSPIERLRKVVRGHVPPVPWERESEKGGRGVVRSTTHVVLRTKPEHVNRLRGSPAVSQREGWHRRRKRRAQVPRRHMCVGGRARDCAGEAGAHVVPTTKTASDEILTPKFRTVADPVDGRHNRPGARRRRQVDRHVDRESSKCGGHR